jgi:FkbM family methyltransferase
MLVLPASDLNFATSRQHGEVAQREQYNEVMRFVKSRRTAVDAGAHVGIWTRLMAKDFSGVLAFEPNAENFACLERNASALSNVLTARAALGASSDTAAQVLPVNGNSGMWHLVPGTDFEIQPLDSYQLTDVDLLKIDVEGFEGQVLLGARQTIVASKPVVVFEDNGVGAKYYGAAWVDPKPVLKSLGYKLRFHWRKDEIWIPC